MSTKKGRLISLRLSHSDIEELQAVADENLSTPSSEIRRAIREYLQRKRLLALSQR